MQPYDHNDIEKKWQTKWEQDKLYETHEDSSKESFYVLDMFPYPSGEGLHVGHPKGYIATDVLSRYMRMNGKQVLHPMGWDAFGLPAENYAIKNKIHPREAVEKNVDYFKSQLEKIGLDYDWSREINTTDPAYYKWTQWIFLQMFKKGLAYESHEPINWCPSCKTGLANEDLEDGKCERCGSEIEKKPLRQWVLKITDYAERMLADLDALDWPESIKESQRNWIGKSEGLKYTMLVKDVDLEIQTFSTHFEAYYADTFVVIAPDHPVLDTLIAGTETESEVRAFADDIVRKRLAEGYEADKESLGIFTGRYAVDPVTGADMPIWVASFVLADYGTGIVRASCHDERDFAFAKKYDIPLRPVLFPQDADEREKVENLEVCYTDMVNGVLSEPAEFVDKRAGDHRKDIAEFAERAGYAEQVTVYKLRDWVFSRQRYWGEPIPLIHCEKCGVVSVPEDQLPVELPDVEFYEPTGTGESPLAGIDEWVNTTCPECGGTGKRETNTMPQWAGSCWYYLRYMDPSNADALVSKDREKYWAPVDMYVGGAEHATRHLIYARFWHKFLYDIGVVSTEEPFARLQHVGLIRAEDGRKMSKRYGNVVNPDDVVAQFGADTLRVYTMFMGPFDQSISWSTDSMVGARRFVEKVWRLSEKVSDEHEISSGGETKLHQTIKKVSKDIYSFDFNTAISSLMELVNVLEKESALSAEVYGILVRLVAPFAPHATEELWHIQGNSESVHCAPWPTYDESKLVADTVRIVVQINGKMRDTFEAPSGLDEEELKKRAYEQERICEWISGKTVENVIVIPEKLVNIVIK